MDKNQVVCGCRNVVYGQLVDAVANGAKSFEEVKAATNVSGGCGKCEANVRVLVEELLKKQP